MANEVLSGPFLHKRGTTDKVAAYTGPAGELVVDLTKKTVAVQDGTTAGGVPLALEGRTFTPGTGVKINNGSAAVTLANDMTLSVDAAALVDATNPGTLTTDMTTGALKTTFSLDYTPATGVLNVKGADGTTTVATVTIPSSVSALTTAELLVATPSSPVDGHTSGTYFHFAYTLSTGTTSDIYIDVTSLIDIYTAADDSVTVANNTIAVKVKPNSGIETTATGVAAKIKANSGIAVDADGLQVVVDATKALSVGASGIGVELSSTAGNQLQFDANGKLLVPAAADITVVSEDSGNVLQEGTDDGALLKLASTNNAAQTNASGELIVPLDCGVLS